jgi:hypothetical protein
MEGIAPLISRFGVKATIFEPGPVATDLFAAHRRERLIAPEPVRDNPYVDPLAFLERRIASTGAVQSSEEAATIVVDLLNADEPPLRVQNSAWTTEFLGVKLADTDGSGAFKALDEYLRWGD